MAHPTPVANTPVALTGLAFSSLFQLVKSNDPRLCGMPNVPPPVACTYCGAPRYYIGHYLSLDHIIWSSDAEPCSCPQGAAAHYASAANRLALIAADRQAAADSKLHIAIAHNIGDTGIGVRYSQCSLATSRIIDDNRTAIVALTDYVAQFPALRPSPANPAPQYNGIYIAGPTGTGKTHLAMAVANDLQATGVPVISGTTWGLLSHIRQSYGTSDGNADTIMDLYRTVPLLVLDDLGKDYLTAWSLATIYTIVDARYAACLPIIVTTNYQAGDLVQRMVPQGSRDDTTARCIVDRLLGSCRGISLDGPSWRTMLGG